MTLLNRISRLGQRLAEIFGPRLIGVIAAIYFALFAALIAFPSTSAPVENWLFDLKHRTASFLRRPHESLVIAGIDMQTLESARYRWPWPREKVAELVDLIGVCGPRAIVLDILFQNEDTEIGDRELARAIGQKKNVLLVAVMEEKTTSQGVSLKRFSSHSGIISSALAEGFVWGIMDSDGRLRQFKLSDQRLLAKSCAFEVAKRFFPALSERLKALPESAPVVFARKNGGIPVISALDIIQKKAGVADFLKDRIVILGVTAPAVHDYHNTSLGIVAGAEILAASFDTVLSDRIGQTWHNNQVLRGFSALLGAVLSAQLVLGWKLVFMFPMVIGVCLLVMLAITELMLLHLPLAPFLLMAFFVASLLFAARYLDHLFALQDMRHEAQNAKEVQERLLPRKMLSHQGFTVCGSSKSANELCGDYYDYFLVKDRYMLVFIGDATGHGISAALAMSVAKSAMLSAVNQGFSPQQIIESINLVLFQAMQQKVLMTAALLWLDTETGDFTYHNCGHPYPYVLGKDGSISQISSLGGFLGRKPEYRFKSPFTGNLGPGERLVFYTDGIIESFPGSAEGDGFELFRVYLSLRPRLALKEFCEDIIASHPFFVVGGAQPDDFTVLTVERDSG